MRRILSTGTMAIACAFITTLLAQTSTPKQPAHTDHDMDRDRDRQRSVTLTGCLTQGAGDNFMLTNVMSDTTMPNQTAGTSGKASGATGTTMGGMNIAGSYELIGRSRTELKAHVNKEVRVTGTIRPQGRGPAAPRLNVRSVEPMNEPCEVAEATPPAGTSSPTPAGTAMTFTGCLQASGNTFTLTNVVPSGAASGEGSASPGSGGASSAPKSGGTMSRSAPGVGASAGTNMPGIPAQLTLVPAAGTNLSLSAHAGHKVRVTGTMEGASTLRITSIEHVASTCS